MNECPLDAVEPIETQAQPVQKRTGKLLT